MTQTDIPAVDLYAYEGNISREFIDEALRAYRTYKSDKEQLIERIKDNEQYYRRCYEKLRPDLESRMFCSTSFIMSAIENLCADASESYPEPNILERDAEGEKVAEVLSKLVPIQLERADFKKTFKDNTRRKAKYGTAIYGVFYNEATGGIDIKSIDIMDIYVDMHLANIQDSSFVFIPAAVDNEVLKRRYPQFEKLFTGDATVDNLYGESYTLDNRSIVLDCYYKKPDGCVHLMKICSNTVIAATEDMKGYGNGLYNHGKYPIVFDVMYPIEHSPFGFGLIDMGKTTQTAIDKLDSAITKNISCASVPRYLVKRNSGINPDELRDFSRQLIEYEGDGDSIKPVETSQIHGDILTYRESKKDELKELLANRDFQQGATSGGVTAASAIEALQQSGEKRARSMISDSYDAYKDIVKMVIEIMRQFFDGERSFRTKDENGKKSFMYFSNAMMYNRADSSKPLEFDIDIVPQRENPYTREMMNSTMLTMWQSGAFKTESVNNSIALIRNMSFDGKEKLIADLEALKETPQTPAPGNVPTQTVGPMQEMNLGHESAVNMPQPTEIAAVSDPVPVPIAVQ